jgi:hypothetical protein
MWYWVCEGNKKNNRIAFTVKHCVANIIKAEALVKVLKYKNRDDKDYDIWIHKSLEHSDPDFKQYVCPNCGNKMSKKELDNTWDWAGPHCNKCGCTGMDMFQAATMYRPIMTGYQSLMNKYRMILGKKKINEIEKE